VKRDWEIIADNQSKACFSWGCVSAFDSEGRTVWIVDAHRGDGHAARFTSFGFFNRTRSGARTTQHACQGIQARIVTKADRAGPRCSTQRAGIAPPHAEGDGLSGETFDGETFAFICGPAGVVGGVPLTRAMNPWAMPEASR
jgi:hypothetical protein